MGHQEDKRQYVRISVQFRSHFSAKGQMVADDGDLRDLSPGGCRITSPTAVPVGIELELCIFPEHEPNPFLIDGASVRWAKNQEFAFAAEGQFGTPKGTEGTRIFKATEHPHYSGEFHIKGARTILIGSLVDTPPWDHLDYAGKRLTLVPGTIEIDVNEVTNTGQVLAEFIEGTDRYRMVFDRFAAKQPFQDGGIATRIYEHGDSGNGDPLYPKTWLYLGGWGTATMYKNDQPLYKDYDAHFMVMERSRNPKTHEVRYPMKRNLPGGETDPAGMEIDLWVRSKEQNPKNFPPFETFVHLFWEEVTWR